MNRNLLLMTLVSATFFSFNWLEATQRQSSERRIRFPQQRERIEREIEARFDQIVMETLQLSAQEAAEIRSVWEKSRQERRVLADREESLKRLVNNCISPRGTRRWERVNMGWEDAPGCGEVPEGTLREMIDLRLDESLLYKKEMETLMGIINHRQILLLVAMREEIRSHAERIRSGESRKRSQAKKGPGDTEY